jgi:cyclopropane fatty-acyl-phospholipid synthase-like methyltransferase
VNVQSNWWENFFEGVSVELWLQAVSPEHTEREAESLSRLLAVQPGAQVLDVPCGGGRLSLALASRGYRMTGVDRSAEFLNHARSCHGSEAVSWERRDMRDLPWSVRFDGAFCLGNSFGYLDDEGNSTFLSAVARVLKPGARFVLETPMVLENLLRHLQDRPWWKVGDMYLFVENQYDHERGRLDIAYTFLSNGRVETRCGSHRAYTYRELVTLIEAAGFTVELSPPWARDAHMVTFIATRVS